MTKQKSTLLYGCKLCLAMLLSLCAALVLTMNFALPEIPLWYSPVTRFFRNLSLSTQGTEIASSLLTICFFYVWQKLTSSPARDRRKKGFIALRVICLVLAGIWLMAASYRIDNTLVSLHSSPGQIAKAYIYFAGSYFLLTLMGELLYWLLTQPKRPALPASRVISFYHRHTFIISFALILLCWLPHLILSYPANMTFDTWMQLKQFLIDKSYIPGHPLFHTLFMGSIVKIGMLLGSANLGLFLFIAFQTVIFALILAYEQVELKEMNASGWFHAIHFAIAVFSPFYFHYIGVALKDMLYSYFYLLYIIEIIAMTRVGLVEYSRQPRHLIPYAIAVFGVYLFRNNGKLILFPMTLLIAICFIRSAFVRIRDKKPSPIASRARYLTGCFLVLPLVLAMSTLSILSAVCDLPTADSYYDMSIFLQQTARYATYYGDDITEEEKEILNRVTDLDSLVASYNPLISDPVKLLWVPENQEDIDAYMRIWFNQMCRHPFVYVEAIVNQNYRLVAPSDRHIFVYRDAVYPSLTYISDQLNVTAFYERADYYQEEYALLLFTLPVTALFSWPAFYILCLIFMTCFAIRKRNKAFCFAVLPVIINCIGIIFAPVADTRYLFPIIFSTPILAALFQVSMRRENSTTALGARP